MLPIEMARELRSAAQFQQYSKNPTACAARLMQARELCLQYGMDHEADQLFYSNTADKRIYNAALLNRIGPLAPH